MFLQLILINKTQDKIKMPFPLPPPPPHPASLIKKIQPPLSGQ